MPQLNNMAAGGPFITALRKDWSTTFDDHPPFQLFAVGGDRDQFVPPESSLSPFPPKFQRVVAGDHLSMVKPKNARAESLCLLKRALTTQSEPPAASAPLRTRGFEMSEVEVEQALAERGDQVTQTEVVHAAIRLDLDGKRQEAIELLERNTRLGSDVKGTLGGRFKRLWLETGDEAHAKRTLEYYKEG